MEKTLFLQSDMPDPYALYTRMLDSHPVYWDEGCRLWAVYSYAGCRSVLTHPLALIPPLVHTGRSLNEYARLITGKLVRLRNGEAHRFSREVTMQLFGKLRPVPPDELIGALIPAVGRQHAVDGLPEKPLLIDWVDTVCKRLPVLAVIKGFGFPDMESQLLLGQIDQLVAIMASPKTEEQVNGINAISEKIYELTEEVIATSDWIRDILDPYTMQSHPVSEELIPLCIGNLIGLIIQSYDAGRGLLSNSLLQMLLHDQFLHDSEDGRHGNGVQASMRQGHYMRIVQETLRFDPPVQHTRRVAGDDMVIGGKTIRKGEQILVLLAAANRDPEKFCDADRFDIHRSNNSEHMTFGDGHHLCLAKHFSTVMAAGVLDYLFHGWSRIRLMDTRIEYEPKANVRLPVRLMIGLDRR